MTADVRSTSRRELFGPGTVPAPDGVRAGDTLICFHSTSSDFAAMGAPAGGGAWILLDSFPGIGWGGTNVWRKKAGASEPSEYGVVQGPAAGGVVTIVAVKNGDGAHILVRPSGGTGGGLIQATPTATPETASGLDIRYVAGVRSPATAITWDGPAGYVTRVTQQYSTSVTAALATKVLVSSAHLDGAQFSSSAALTAWTAYTLIVPSSDSIGDSGPPPTPPSFPSFSPSRGLATMRYTCHDFLTGDYRGDLYPQGVTMDRRDGEAGVWQGFLPIPDDNEKAAAKIKEIFPEDPEDLTSGPGRLVVHSWRAGVLCGIHWLHTASPAKNSRLGLGLQLAGSTLDGYMQSVALTEDVEFDGDQLDVMRAFIAHMSADPRSNPGFAIQGGVSGVMRPLVAKAGDFYGKVLRDYARAGDGFSYVVNPTTSGGSIERRLNHGSPFLSLDEEYMFAEGRHGGEVTDWSEITSALSGGTRFGIVGGTPPAADATQGSAPVRSTLIETPHLAAGWPIIDQRIQHPLASTDLTELERYGAFYARTAAGAPRVFSANVILGKGAQFDPNGIGAMARFKLSNAWHGSGAERRRRLIGWSLTPADRTTGGKDRLGLIVAQEVPS